MKLVRSNIFETNSSSTHVLVIPHNVNEEEYNLYDSLDHDYAFGRGESRLVDYYDEKLAYVYYVLKNFEERTIYHKENPNDSYGADCKVTEETLNAFKDKVRQAYKEIYEKLEYKPYNGDPLPDDIFYLIDHNGSLNKLDFELGWDDKNKKYVAYEIKDKADLTRELTKEEKAIQDEFELEDNEVVVFDQLNDDEQEIARLMHILPDYVSGYYNEVYVDHVEDFGTNGFLEKIINADVDYIKKLIFNKDSYITVGGDEYRGYNVKTIGFEDDYEYKYEKDEIVGEFWDKLKEYEKDNDVYLKGN